MLHDLHESVPFLYDNTLGTSPYNAWLDPIVTNEWEKIAWVNVDEMTKRGMPGVFTHGTFTTWDPSYLYFIYKIQMSCRWNCISIRPVPSFIPSTTTPS